MAHFTKWWVSKSRWRTLIDDDRDGLCLNNSFCLENQCDRCSLQAWLFLITQQDETFVVPEDAAHIEGRYRVPETYE